MLVTIIAGGSGSRLWPLSKPSFPKHLLCMVGEKSLLQKTVERALLLACPEDVYIISEKSHIEHVHKQLPSIPRVNILAEPDRRGTASCVIAVLGHIKKTRPPTDEAIVFMHADHYIQNTASFAENLRACGKVSKQHQRMVLLGVNPTYPATGFGYIQKSSFPVQTGIYEVVRFKEKPDATTAEVYMADGSYLWNMGYFIAPLMVFEQCIEQYASELWAGYQLLLSTTSPAVHDATYLSLPSGAIDTALIERVPDLLVACGEFDWADIGSYGDLHNIHDKDEHHNTTKGIVAAHDTHGSLIINSTNIPVAVIGLDNVAVIATENGFLVTHKSQSQKVGDVSKELLARL